MTENVGSGQVNLQSFMRSRNTNTIHTWTPTPGMIRPRGAIRQSTKNISLVAAQPSQSASHPLTGLDAGCPMPHPSNVNARCLPSFLHPANYQLLQASSPVKNNHLTSEIICVKFLFVRLLICR